MIPPESAPTTMIHDWILTKEKLDWTIGFPIAPEAPLAELQAKAVELGEPTSKMTKAQLQRRLGRKQSLKLLSAWK